MARAFSLKPERASQLNINPVPHSTPQLTINRAPTAPEKGPQNAFESKEESGKD